MWTLLLLALLFVLVAPLLWLLLVAVVLAHSAAAVLTIPRHLLHLARDRQTRRNHALEHATVNVLEQRYGPTWIAGEARRNGFYLYNVPFSDAEVLDACEEAIARLAAGEHDLAIHPRCGTSQAVGMFLLSAVFLIVFFFAARLGLLGALAAVLLAILLSHPAGRWAQRWLTTSPDVADMRITGLYTPLPSEWAILGILLTGRMNRSLFIETRPATRVVVRTTAPAARALNP